MVSLRPSMDKIKNIVFDFGRVLVGYDFEPFMRGLFSDPVEREAFKAVFIGHDFVAKCDKGDLSFHDLIEEYKLRYPQWKEQVGKFEFHQLAVMTGEMPGMKDLLERLRAAGYKLYGLTNWSAEVYKVIEKYDILSMLDGRVISSEEKIIKPSPEIYRCLCERYSLKPQECLFTDDKQPNIDGAIAAGMHAVLFTDAASFESYLKQKKLL